MIKRIWSLLHPLIAGIGRNILNILPDSLSVNHSKKIVQLIPHPLDQLSINIIEGGPLAGRKIFANTRRSKAYIEGNHEPELVSWLQKHCKPGMTVVDIGSHEGYIMLLMAELVGSAGHVFAFEPISELFEGLKITRISNKFEQIVLENSAVGASDSQATIHLQASSRSASHSLAPSEISDKTDEINVVALDSYFKKRGWPHIDLIKLDVEGFETDAIKGMHKLLVNSLPICAIELHLWQDPSALVSIFVDLKYQFTLLDGGKCSANEIQRRFATGNKETMIVVAFPPMKS
jgi:FkbM family methyltransferase